LQPPVYPAAMKRQRMGGEVVLSLRLDGCGKVVDARLETTSGHPELDDAAVAAAKNWHFGDAVSGDGSQSSRMRVPIRFDPDTLSVAEGGGQRPQDAFFDSRRRMTAPSPVLDGQGNIPGYVADEFPVGVGSVAEAHAMLERLANSSEETAQGVREYLLIDAEGVSRWEIFDGNWAWAPTVVRSRAVGDGKRGWWVVSYLCEADARQCEKLKQFFSGMPAQDFMTPPPPPPRLRQQPVD
jgi:TonB family protein